MKWDRQYNRISSLSFRTMDQAPLQEDAPPEEGGRRLGGTILLFALPAVFIALLGCLVFWYQGRALAAERVLDPDRVLTAAPEAKPLDPLLEEGEDMRSATRYRDRTVALGISDEDLYHGFLLVVNDRHILPADYLPEDLAVTNDLADALGQAVISVSKARLEMDKTAAENLMAMAAAAYQESGTGGWLLQSGYRDFAYQAYLHQRKVDEYRNAGYGAEEAERAAAFWVARSRESEHNTGLAADVTSRTHPDLQPSFARAANGLWLAENSWRFGFIVRYPEEKTGITKVGFEPWHIRYVGRPHSDFIRQKGWCLEEYMDFLIREGGYTYKDENGIIWQVDYQEAKDHALEVPADLPYTVSGDGAGGFIVTVRLDNAPSS